MIHLQKPSDNFFKRVSAKDQFYFLSHLVERLTRNAIVSDPESTTQIFIDEENSGTVADKDNTLMTYVNIQFTVFIRENNLMPYESNTKGQYKMHRATDYCCTHSDILISLPVPLEPIS